MWGTRQGETFTHFLSLEYKKDETFKLFQRKVADLQEKVSEVAGVGKPSKPESLHLTIATLKVTEEEVTELKNKTNAIFKKYSDMLALPCGLSTTYRGIGFGDWGAVWIECFLGQEAVTLLREIVEEELGHLLTDLRFHSHMTIFRGSDLTDERKSTLQAAVKEMRLGSATVGDFTLRMRKTGKAVEPALVTLQFADTASN
jgi:2'-5' RNA ligase